MNTDRVEEAIYEQCPYDWSHVSAIYRSIDTEPEEALGWYGRAPKNGISVRYRRRGRFFQWFTGDENSSLFSELLELEPMQSQDDDEWTIEKHGDGEYLVRTVFTKTYGPVAEQGEVDGLLAPYGLWLENRESFVSGAATFSLLEPSELWNACERLRMVERWCIDANILVDRELMAYWHNVSNALKTELEKNGKIEFGTASGVKKREPLLGDGVELSPDVGA